MDRAAQLLAEEERRERLEDAEEREREEDERAERVMDNWWYEDRE